MKFLNQLYRLDWARLYYSDGLIGTIVVISLMVTIISFLIFVWLLFKENSKVEDYQSRKKTIMKTGALCFVSFIFIVSVFRFAHIWNQTINAL